ncbi:UpxY family transcription antiterminator [Puia sp.]|uniref:UpxY family transcription antiterminator n=1 Tax=Puia sp. TaxID=2045100 RepID=UPI002F427FBE
MIMNWYALYTKPRWEKKVAENLARNGFESYCPLNKVLHQWHDRKKWILEPLFSSYVFVQTEENRHPDLMRTAGVVNLVYWLRKPAVIRQEEVDAIKRFTGQYPNVQLEKTMVNLNDRVRVVKGPLITQEGDVIAVNTRTVKIALPSLGYIMVAEVEKQNIEIVTTSGAITYQTLR